MSNFCAILYSPPHLLMLVIDRHILMLTTATYYNYNSLNTEGTEESYRNEL